MDEKKEYLSCSLNTRKRLVEKSVFVQTGTKRKSLFCVANIKGLNIVPDIQVTKLKRVGHM
jgi:hypothetical protein